MSQPRDPKAETLLTTVTRLIILDKDCDLLVLCGEMNLFGLLVMPVGGMCSRSLTNGRPCQ